MWATEFGQNTWNELNRIEPGANYGWPIVEGVGGRAGFVDPVPQWPTSEASPSGLGIVDDPGTSRAFFGGELGRIRDAVAGPEGTLLVETTTSEVAPTIVL